MKFCEKIRVGAGCCIALGSISLLQPSFSHAQIEFGTSPNPVGSGARALGMGGAFIAIADDATAASWNPGGLTQLELPEISVVGGYYYRQEENNFVDHPESTIGQNVSQSNLNYLSISYPFSLFDKNMVVSANYQHLFDFSRDWELPFNFDFALTNGINTNVDYEQSGQISAIGLAYAVDILPSLSLGFTLNFWEDGIRNNSWDQNLHIHGSGIDTILSQPVTYAFDSFESYDFSGFNVNIGALWQVNGKITLGAVVKTPFQADLEHKTQYEQIITYTGLGPAVLTDTRDTSEQEKLDMPMSYGIGLAYRFSDAFTASVDVYRTEWDDFIHTDASGVETSFVTGDSVDDSDIEETNQVRIGAEYLFIKPKCIVPVRGGLFYDPAPAKGGIDEYYGFSLGSGIAYKKIVFDVAYQYRFGNNVNGSLVRGQDFSQNVDEHTIFTSLIIHF